MFHLNRFFFLSDDPDSPVHLCEDACSLCLFMICVDMFFLHTTLDCESTAAENQYRYRSFENNSNWPCSAFSLPFFPFCNLKTVFLYIV